MSPEDAKVSPPRMIASARVPTPGIEIRQEYWLLWADVAIREAKSAADALAVALDSASADTEVSAARYFELKAGTQGICAAAFSVEALCYLISPYVLSPSVIQKWKARWPGGLSMMHMTLKNALAVSTKDSKTIREDLERVILNRNEAVHYDKGFESPVPMPGGVLGSPASVRFGADAAQEAVRAMSAMYTAVVDHPASGLKHFATQQSLALKHLAGGKPWPPEV